MADLINTGVALNVVSKSGSWYNWGEQKLGQGMEGSRQFLKENPKIEKLIAEAVRKAAAAAETA